MLVRVVHETRYDYVPAVEVAQHMAYLQPVSTATQHMLRHALEVEPPPNQQTPTLDVYGNTRTFISLQSGHARLRVVATSVVSTQARPLPVSHIPWEQVREYFRYRKDGPYDPAAEFVFTSPYVPRHADFATYARASFPPAASLLVATTDLMHRIHADFKYETESTEVNTPALEALAQRKGVCQDFAHIMIACLRSMGLAARYVSGYLLTRPAPGAQRLVGGDASHAWISVLLPDLPSDARWCDFDPTNDRWGWGSPGEDYVVLAIGRDYSDVSPIRGVIHGGANHSLKVAVTVTPLDADAPDGSATPGGPAPAPGGQSQQQSQCFGSQQHNWNGY